MKRARRGRGESSIFQRKDGRWTGSLSLGFVNGKRQRRSVYAKTKREVEQKLLELKREAATGTLIAPSRESFAEYLAEWLTVHSTSWSGATVETYTIVVNKHITPQLLVRALLIERLRKAAVFH